MNAQHLFNRIKEKKSFLCIGLDTDIERIPDFLLDSEDPVFEFNKQIVKATCDVAVAYKPNLAFYESFGHIGMRSLEKTVSYIKDKFPELLLIADAKRCDIDNTSRMYAKAYFDRMKFDAITLSPYMGKDSIAPYLEYKDKWSIILALTSNSGSSDFQFSTDTSGEKLYERVIKKVSGWGTIDNTMFVVGAQKQKV
jgi:orotidine-5'-phosphate decarboxylase